MNFSNSEWKHSYHFLVLTLIMLFFVLLYYVCIFASNANKMCKHDSILKHSEILYIVFLILFSLTTSLGETTAEF